MTLIEFVDIIAGCHADLDLMVRGHPFAEEDILEALGDYEPDSAQAVALNAMLKAAR